MRARRRSIWRERLLTALDDWRACRLLRVVAPAGFGKSTLGAQWFQQLAELPEAERPASAWIALDATDDVPERFLHRFVSALQRDFPDSADLLVRGLAAEQPPLRLMCELLNMLGRHPSPVVLLFDDVHRLRDAATLALLQAILDDGPPNLHTALLSRTRPNLQTGRLSLDQTMLTLSAQDLRFDHGEFTALVAETPLAALDASQLASLEERAAGWAAGLQILLQASRHGDFLSFERSAAAVAEDFWEYIEHEVLQNLPQRELDFLLDVSLLPFLTVDLCAAVTGLAPAECTELLRQIATGNDLVTAPRGLVTARRGLDAARTGHVHAVLRNFLLRRLMQRRTWDQLRVMRRRAALHLADAGEIDAALDMLLPPPDSAGDPSLHWLGDDVDAAADLVERAGHAALQQGELVAVRRWMRKLPDTIFRTRPRLAVDSVWVTVHHLEPASDHALQRIDDALRAAPERVDDALRAELVALEAIRGLSDGHYAASWDALQRARALPILPNSLAEAFLELSSGYMMYGWRRSLEERMRDLRRSNDLFARIGYLRGRIAALCLETSLRRIYASGGGLVAGVLHTRQFMDDIGVDAGSYRAMLVREFGDSLYAMNQIAAARAEFHTLRRLFDQEQLASETPYVARVRLQLCDLADGAPLDIDDDDDEREWEALRRKGNGLIMLNTAHRRIQRDMLRARPDLCWQTVVSLGLLPHDLTPDTPPAHALAVLGGALFAGRHLDALESRLLDFRAHMDAVEHRFFKLHAHALLVQLHVMRRDVKTARLELEALLSDLEPGGFVRIVLDLPMIHPLLRNIDMPFAARLAALIPDMRSTPSIVSQAEQRVLVQLAEGLTAVQIAEHFFLSPETVRSHIKSIYAKLGVSNRIHALAKVREMGLM